MISLKKRVISLCLGMVCLFSFNSFCQDTMDASGGKMRLQSYVMSGASWTDIDDLNDIVQARGLEEFSNSVFTIGFGWQKLYHRFVSGVEVQGLFWGSEENGANRASLWAAEIFYDLGVDFLNMESALIYPLVGIGGGYTKFGIGPDDRTFAAALDSVPLSFEAHKYSFLLDLGLGAFYNIPVMKRFSSFSIGVRAGYKFDFSPKSKWISYMTSLDGGPQTQLEGFYVKGCLGNVINFNRIARLIGSE